MVFRAFLVLSALALSASPARAGQICNETSYVIYAALAWETESGLLAQGWERLRPGGCASVAEPDGVQETFLYARTSEAYLGPVREWRGARPICVDRIDFQFQGETICGEMGLEHRDFRRLSDIERQRVVLMEPEDYRQRADEAGLQRLLQTAGYDVRLIDGYAGRRTRRAVSAFEASVERDFGEDRNALIDALEDYAILRNVGAGLQVCNQTDHPIGAAVGRVREEGEESRGWWRVEPGSCARPVAVRLAPDEAFLYAKLLGPEGLRALSIEPDANGAGAGQDGAAGEGGAGVPEPAAPQSFCIAPARFLAEGRGDCEARGYESAAFRPLPPPEEGGVVVTLIEADFAAPVPAEAVPEDAVPEDAAAEEAGP